MGMKKIYNSPVIDTIELARPLMDGGSLAGSGDPGSGFAPQRRQNKPF